MVATVHVGLIRHQIQNALVRNLEIKKVVSVIVAYITNCKDKILQEATDFLKNEIKQYEIAMNGVLRDSYRKYLERKTLYFQALLDAILTIKGEFQGETKEGER